MDDHRARVIDTYYALLVAHHGLAGVQVEAGDPGADHQAECVWLDVASNEGTYEIPAFGPDPVVYVDEWTLPVQVTCKPRGRWSLADLRGRLGELVAPTIDVVRRNPGLVDAELTDVFAVESFVVRDRADGVVRTPEGPLGLAVVNLSCRSRLL